jgi:hypothetical protein
MPPKRLDIRYPNPLSQVYLAFEAYCVGACCGDAAYDLNAWRLVELVQVDGIEQLVLALDQLDTIIDGVAAHKGSVGDGELIWSKKGGSLTFLGRMQTEMLRMLVHVQGTSVFDATWLAPNGRTVELLARSMAKTRCFGNSPILADALEEADCVNVDLLTRCRNVRLDARANWVVNLLACGADGVFNRPIEPTPERA